MDWGPLILTFQLAGLTTLLLLLVGLPLATTLAYRRFRLKPVVETLVSMPLVLPPTVLGFYILMVFSPQSALGDWLDRALGLQLVFSFEGLIVASMIYSLPFMVQPLQAGLSQIPTSLREAAYTLGKSRWQTFWKVVFPNLRPALLTGSVLAFAHTVGEFGVVLMIGGNIPGETRVASIAIYDQVESLNYDVAHRYSLVLFAITFAILLTVYLINSGYLKRMVR